MQDRRELPRCGGLIEDETGAWRIVEVREDEGAVILEDHDGVRAWRSFSNLGTVHYDSDVRIPEGDAFDDGDGSNYAEAEEH